VSPTGVGKYYVLTRPDRVVRVEAGRPTPLAGEASTTWSRPGPGRRAAAAAVLADALGHEPHAAAVHGFTCDVLDYYGTASQLVLSIEEVCAWYSERGPELARSGARPFTSLPPALAERDSELSAGPRPGWLAVYRTVHGEPDLPETRPRAS
jgi:hypothetical protein